VSCFGDERRPSKPIGILPEKSKAFQQNDLNLATHVNDADSSVEENWKRFKQHSKWSRTTLATCNQIHSSIISEVKTGGHHNLNADALISRTPGIAVGIFTADCVPILLVNPKKRHVAAVHCGWRGVEKRLVSKTIEQLIGTDREAIKTLIIWIGASIRCDSYEVGPEVANLFNTSVYTPGKPGKFQLDLVKALRLQLLEAGALNVNIEDCNIDTYKCNDSLFSFRAEGGKTGRMMTFVGFSE